MSLQITEERVKAAAAKFPGSKPVFEELFPTLFCKGFKSGTIFFKKYDLTASYRPTGGNGDPDYRPQSLLAAIGDGVTHRLYVLCHLQNAKEYGLFNLATGYQLVRNAIYQRDPRIGVVIPDSVLDKLILIKEGDGSGPCS